MAHDGSMATYLLTHRHSSSECPVAFAAWKGFASPLRHQAALSSCNHGGHQLWWTVEAPAAVGALGLLPPYVARRSEEVRSKELAVP